jgi:hypothetical protein
MTEFWVGECDGRVRLCWFKGCWVRKVSRAWAVWDVSGSFGFAQDDRDFGWVVIVVGAGGMGRPLMPQVRGHEWGTRPVQTVDHTQEAVSDTVILSISGSLG